MRIAVSTPMPVTNAPVPPGASRYPAKRFSLETKPSSGGSPAIDAAESPASTADTGITRQRPVSSRMSRLPTSRSMTPTSMNSVALKSACAMVCTLAAAMATGVPTPTAAVSNPSWLTVE